MIFLLFTFFVAVGELLYEGVMQEIKMKWLANPWVFCLIPILIASVVSLNSWNQRPEQYDNGLWLDLFSVHIGILLYLLSRELFTFLFVPKVVKQRKNAN
jgi:cytochrome bd-type quinol oxidase subunit 2